VVLSVILTLEHVLRIGQFNLADKALDEAIKAGFSPEIAAKMVAKLPSLRKGRRSKLYSIDFEIPVRSGQTPWPAPYVATLVLEAMLQTKEQSNSQLMPEVIACLGGSPDQLARYRKRLAKILVPRRIYQPDDPSKISVIDWLVEGFEYYPKSWKEEPELPWLYNGSFIYCLPPNAVVALVKNPGKE